ncbi:2Fe-2S iron-sulfur cluster-binding protein [Cesiribacter andamanensis]|uniref:2Fe-2S ferredoxin-5 n=1 Tax=Cesiribacter andamanensis AMV16 TaxID=1279009 RepID=M7NPH4_9BACT|nr:2Fe-2S iron-sulfur cluster-binding protein [Cesiribacter andamanensis]EMR03620.1 2Fe-2S ferredoxin-5 [Cesiribacter andamanensis AMV16]
MPSVTIQNLANKTVVLPPSVQSILQAFGQEGIDWMQACGQKGRCTTCKMQVLEGEEHLSSLSDNELRMQQLGRLPDGYRLACQCTASGGDVLVRVPNVNKLPHMQYTD